MHDFFALFCEIGLGDSGVTTAHTFIFIIDDDKIVAAIEQKLLFLRDASLRFLVDFEHSEEFFGGHHVGFRVVLDAAQARIIGPGQYHIFIAKELCFSYYSHSYFRLCIGFWQPGKDRSRYTIPIFFLL